MLDRIQNERQFTERLTQQFLDDGYQQLDPKLLQGGLPSGYTPDLAFKRDGEIVIVEVKASEEHRNLEQIRIVKQLIEATPNWKFKLYAAPRDAREPMPQDNLEDIGKLVSNITRNISRIMPPEG